MSVITWLDPADCFPPHGLDMTAPRNYQKVEMLMVAFAANGFDRTKSALIGYPLDGAIQLLSGTQRHRAALIVGIKLPVMLWRREDIETVWGSLDEWKRVMEDIPVYELESWTREDIERKRAIRDPRHFPDEDRRLWRDGGRRRNDTE